MLLLLFYRWFLILSPIFGLLILTIAIHLLVEKCFHNCNSVDLENGENQENVEEPMQYLMTPFYALIRVSFLLILGYFLHTVSIHVFVPRLTLLLKDSYEIISSAVHVLLFYIRNPYLRSYVLRNILSSSSVQPQQNEQIEIELQTF